jgi:hypothetical protein
LVTHETKLALEYEQRVTVSSGDGFQVRVGPAKRQRAGRLVHHFTGKLSDASGIISDEVSGLIREIPGTPPGWAGYLLFPVGLAGRIRAAENYRLDIDDGQSIAIVTDNKHAALGHSIGSIAFNGARV